MKRILVALLIALFALGTVGCSNSTPEEKPEGPSSACVHEFNDKTLSYTLKEDGARKVFIRWKNVRFAMSKCKLTVK